MKRIYLSALSTLLASSVAYGQGEMDAFKLSRNDLTGTARSVSMGGAFGALGGDISAISINPAGIGIYQSSEIATTLNFQNVKTTANSADLNKNFGNYDHNKFKFTFDNIGFVGAFPLNSDEVPLLNFGFTYNRIKSFDRKYETGIRNASNSITDFMAARANGFSPNELLWTEDSNKAWNHDWFAVLGYNGAAVDEGGLINPSDPHADPKNKQSYQSAMRNKTVDSKLFVKEKGYINTYDFNMGTTFSDIISAGITVSVTDIDYRLMSNHLEKFYDNELYNGNLLLTNNLETEGTGWQVSTGVIIKPIHELRIGIAYHSPTWYKMTDYYTMSSDFDLDAWKDNDMLELENRKGYVDSPQGGYDYKLRTPDKWTFSLAGVIGQYGIISVDYELTNYKNNMKLFDDDGNELPQGQNDFIKQDFRNASTLRIGAEARITPQLSIRAGYAWMQKPLENKFKDNTKEVLVTEPNAHYVLDGNINHITWGVGYRFAKSFYTDIAFVAKTQKSDLYAFPNTFEKNPQGGWVIVTQADRSKLKTETFQGMLTLGYRF